MFFNLFKSVTLSSILLATSVFASEVAYLTEEFPPYNYKKGGKITGISTQYVLETFKMMGNGLTLKDIKLVPWDTGYKAAQDPSRKVVLFSTTRTKEREDLFKWVGPISKAEHAIIVFKGNPSKVKVPNNGKYDDSKRYGSIKSDINLTRLVDANVPESNVTGVKKFAQLVTLMERGKIDAISYTPAGAFWIMKELGKNTDNYEVLYRETLGELYMAFNKSIDDDTVKAHQDALDKVKADGALVKKIESMFR